MVNQRQERKSLIKGAPRYTPPYSTYLLKNAAYLYQGYTFGDASDEIKPGFLLPSPLALGCIINVGAAFEAFLNQVIYISSDVGKSFDPTDLLMSEPLAKYRLFTKHLGGEIIPGPELEVAMATRNEIAHFVPYESASIGPIRSGLKLLEDIGVVAKVPPGSALFTSRFVSPGFLPWYCAVIESAVEEFILSLPEGRVRYTAASWGSLFSFYRDLSIILDNKILRKRRAILIAKKIPRKRKQRPSGR